MVLLLIISLISSTLYAANDEAALMLRNSNSPARDMWESSNLTNLNDDDYHINGGLLAVMGRSAQCVASFICIAGCCGVLCLEECAVGVAAACEGCIRSEEGKGCPVITTLPQIWIGAKQKES